MGNKKSGFEKNPQLQFFFLRFSCLDLQKDNNKSFLKNLNFDSV